MGEGTHGRREPQRLEHQGRSPPATRCTRDLIELVAGRLPTAGDEVALAPTVASDLGVDVGDRLSLDRPEIALDVVGLVQDPAHLGDAAALVAPGGDLLDAELMSVDTPYGLVDLPDGVAAGGGAGRQPERPAPQ